MMLRLSILSSLLLAAAGCKSTQSFDYSREVDPRRQEYVIGVSDVVRISVWHMPELSVEATVPPDGTIAIPLIGGVVAAGRTAAQMRLEIETRLKSYVKDDSPQVSVAIGAVNSYQFTLAGNFEKSGMYSANRFLTVTEAVALGGGPNRYASLSDLILIRPSPNGPRRIPIDLDAIYKGKHPEMNLVVLAGDTLYLP